MFFMSLQAAPASSLTLYHSHVCRVFLKVFPLSTVILKLITVLMFLPNADGAI